jgi:hypothetical protein
VSGCSIGTVLPKLLEVFSESLNLTMIFKHSLANRKRNKLRDINSVLEEGVTDEFKITGNSLL